MNRLLLTALAPLVTCALSAAAEAMDASVIEAAKKEARVVWYTTNPIDPLVLQLVAAFEKKYPGIKVDYVRSNSSDAALRILAEAKAGHPQADVFDGTTTAEPLKAQGLAVRWTPDVAKPFAPQFKDPDGFWVATNDYVLTLSYNTNLINRGSEPHNWDDLLDPKYRGQIAWSSAPSASAGAGFVGTVLKVLGEEKGLAYLNRLASQKVVSIDAAARAVIDQVIAGEYAITLQSFPENAVFSAKNGAPIQWVVMAPTMTGIVSVAGLVARSLHPNAGKLLYEFMLSEEGQQIYRDAYYIPANPKVAPLEPELTPGRHSVTDLTPAETASAMPRWFDIYKKLFQ